MQYFAYGSNMNLEQMNERCPGNKFLGPARLENYKLVFDGYSEKWNGAVANIVESPGDSVWGGLFKISKANLTALDYHEGYPVSYNRKNVVAYRNEVAVTGVITYYRTGQKPGSPSTKYKESLLRGAKDCGLPEAYINQLKEK